MPASRHITCPALSPVFSHSSVPPVRLSALTFPRHTVLHMFSFRCLCHIVTAPPFPRVCPDLAFRFRVCQFFPPSPSNLVVSFAHDILSIHGPSPYSPPLDGRTRRCDHMWTVHPVLFLAFLPMPSRHRHPPPTVVYLLAFP